MLATKKTPFIYHTRTHIYYISPVSQTNGLFQCVCLFWVFSLFWSIQLFGGHYSILKKNCKLYTSWSTKIANKWAKNQETKGKLKLMKIDVCFCKIEWLAQVEHIRCNMSLFIMQKGTQWDFLSHSQYQQRPIWNINLMVMNNFPMDMRPRKRFDGTMQTINFIGKNKVQPNHTLFLAHIKPNLTGNNLGGKIFYE